MQNEQNNLPKPSGKLEISNKRIIVIGLSVLIIGIVVGTGIAYELVSRSAKKANSSSSGSGAGNNSQTYPASNSTDESQKPLTKVFQDDNLGYSISYPGDWTYQTGDNEITFNGPAGTDAIYSEVDVQNNIQEDNIDSQISDIKGEYDTGQSPQFSPITDYVYTMKDGTKITGKTFKIDYVDGGEAQRDWQIIVPVNGQFFTWEYSSPTDQYDTYLSIAQNMLNSWTINK